jgi:hypothetical protein
MQHNLLTLAAVVLAACLATGCRAVSKARAAVRAERAGEYHVAYDRYCEAAQSLPSDRTILRGINRTAPEAFRYWQRRARAALDREDYQAAWKHLMRALMIRPNDEATPLKIRALEANHAQAVAGARRAWLMDGAETLVVADEPTQRPPRRQGDVQRDDRPAQADQPASVSTDRRMARSHQSESPGSGRRAVTSGRNEPLPSRTSAPPTHGAEAAGSPGRDPGHKPAARPATPHRDRVSYLATATVSRKDNRYPKKVETVDGIFVKIKDTDDDPDADVEIYLDSKRIRRISNWRVGQHVTVVGRSGRLYDIVLRDITDSTESIRVGVRRAR